MTALASVFACRTSATPSQKGNGGDGYFWNFRLLNKVTDALCDVDLYESKEELKPTGSAVITAANALINLPPQDVDSVEIEPYQGELSLIWRAATNKRVKAMFGQAKNSYSVYYEQMADGHVIQSHLEPNADHNYLRERLTWLHS
ncbi:MAG TPA: hypothetical protein VFF95_19275 [Candidatus Binatus sp.]|jgi:hypothetical protein|nr:hypothetical protein [Candidatus Binatus sp.]